MTLILTLIRPEGVWQSADHRVTQKTKVVSDVTTKQLHWTSSAGPNALHLLFGFTGLAEIDRTPTMQWVRETIRGRAWVIDDLLRHLTERLTRDVGKSRFWATPLGLVGGLLEPPGRRYFLEIANIPRQGEKVSRDFHLKVVSVATSELFVAGSGAPYVTKQDINLVRAQANRRPRLWEDHAGLLAAVNRRTAKREPARSVSKTCQVTYVTTETEGASGKFFFYDRSSLDYTLSGTVIGGLDLTDMMDAVRRRTDVNEAAKRAGQGRP